MAVNWQVKHTSKTIAIELPQLIMGRPAHAAWTSWAPHCATIPLRQALQLTRMVEGHPALHQTCEHRRLAVPLAAQLPQLLSKPGSCGGGGALRGGANGGGSLRACWWRCTLFLPCRLVLPGQLRHLAQRLGQRLGGDLAPRLGAAEDQGCRAASGRVQQM